MRKYIVIQTSEDFTQALYVGDNGFAAAGYALCMASEQYGDESHCRFGPYSAANGNTGYVFNVYVDGKYKDSFFVLELEEDNT